MMPLVSDTASNSPMGERMPDPSAVRRPAVDQKCDLNEWRMLVSEQSALNVGYWVGLDVRSVGQLQSVLLIDPRSAVACLNDVMNGKVQ